MDKYRTNAQKKDPYESIKLKLMTGHYRIHYEYLLKQNGLNNSHRGRDLRLPFLRTSLSQPYPISRILWPETHVRFVIFHNSIPFPFSVPFFFFFFSTRLKILNARLSDSGNYSCVPTSGESSSVMVHVINGEWGRMLQMFNMIANKSSNAKIVFDLSFSSCLPLLLCGSSFTDCQVNILKQCKSRADPAVFDRTVAK